MAGESRGEDCGREELIARWIEKYGEIYHRATAHPFILSIRDGTIDVCSFKLWLEQDYLFVREFVPFAASTLLKFSKESDDQADMDIILGGLSSLHEELSWFKTEASRWGLPLVNTIPLEANQEYSRFLRDMEEPEVDYSTAMVAFWAIEAVYQESFSLCLKESSNAPPALIETCRRWGTPSFKLYCDSLRRISNRRLKIAPETTIVNAEAAFLKVLHLEVKFWDMSKGTTDNSNISIQEDNIKNNI